MILSAFITVIRGKLDDKKPPYGWEDDELVACVNETINEVCTSVAMIEDSTTPAICQHALLAGGYALTLSDRITGIQRVELASTGRVLDVIINVDEMDMLNPYWKTADAGVPLRFIKDGLGNNVARVWPATLLADTVNLTVSRLPLVDLAWATGQATELPIPSLYHDKLYEGVLYRAYDKHDTDTENKRLAADHLAKWEKKLEEIRRVHLYKGSVPHTAAPPAGWM